MISCVIDATKGWYVATADITGALSKNYHDKGDIYINMEGEMVNLL